jgi:hypothetical protein
MLHEIQIDLKPCRAAIYHYTYCFAVAFTKGGDAKDLSEAVSCHFLE